LKSPSNVGHEGKKRRCTQNDGRAGKVRKTLKAWGQIYTANRGINGRTTSERRAVVKKTKKEPHKENTDQTEVLNIASGRGEGGIIAGGTKRN